MLNLFLALLLSSFGGLNEGGGEDPEQPKESRLQKMIKWVKKKKKKKNENEMPDSNMNNEGMPEIVVSLCHYRIFVMQMNINSYFF